MTPPPTILFAGGGSGGHLSPGLAVAEALAEVAPESRTLFACSTRAIDETMLRDAGAHHVPIPASPAGLRPRAALRFLRNYRRGRDTAARLLRAEQVDRVLALGGFVSAPVVAAAARLRIPTALLNLDAVPGKANRWVARSCDRVWSAVETPGHPGFAERIVGMPIRRRALATAEPAECRRLLGLDPERPTLLVTGASQGARSLNDLLVATAAADPSRLEGWQIIHLTGAGADESVRATYDRCGVRAEVRPFLAEMGLAWGAADLALSRAGASSVAEAAGNRVPTLFVPYPHHRDRHQTLNVRPLVAAGAAAIAEEDAASPGEDVRSTLLALLADPDRRETMHGALHRLPSNRAALDVARLLLDPAVFKSEA